MVAVLKTVSIVSRVLRAVCFFVLIALASGTPWWFVSFAVLAYLLVFGGYEAVCIGFLLDVSIGAVATPFGTTAFFFTSITLCIAFLMHYLRIRILHVRVV